MADIKANRRSFRPSTRKLIQLYAALLCNANLKGFVKGEIFTSNIKALCVPGLNCYSCPGAIGACPLGAIQNALAATKHRAGWYVLGIVMLFGLTLGRTICGWLCPMGLIQELLHKIPTPKIRKSRVTRTLSLLKYVVLVVFVAAIPLWYALKHDLPLPGFCKYICPAGTLEGAVALLANPGNDALFSMLGLLFTRKFLILLAVLLTCVFCYRAFCRFICPLGAIYGLFNHLALTGVRADAGRCVGCGACVRDCPMDVHRVGDLECISCGRCMASCPTGAISIKCGRVTLAGPNSAARPKRRRALWGVAVLLLALVLVWVNALRPDAGAHSPADEATDSVRQVADFSVELMDGGAFHLAEHRGQVVIINLWATYCTPCVQELPHFSRLQAEHPEIEVLAVHSSLVTDDVAAYLSDKDWQLDFAVDGEDNAVFDAVGGSALLPQTIVLNPEGKAIYNQAGSVTYEALEKLLEMAQEE